MTVDKLIILDRDGVINQDSDNYIKSEEEWIPISGSLEAIARLNKSGYKIAIATNQSGIARGFYDLNVLESMHRKMHKLLEEVGARIDYIAYCPHGPEDGCSCRKPKAGMLIEIANHFDVPAKEISFVGDTASDMKAAKSAGINFILVKTGKGKRTISNENLVENNLAKSNIYESLSDFVDNLLQKHQKD